MAEHESPANEHERASRAPDATSLEAGQLAWIFLGCIHFAGDFSAAWRFIHPDWQADLARTFVASLAEETGEGEEQIEWIAAELGMEQDACLWEGFSGHWLERWRAAWPDFTSWSLQGVVPEALDTEIAVFAAENQTLRALELRLVDGEWRVAGFREPGDPDLRTGRIK